MITRWNPGDPVPSPPRPGVIVGVAGTLAALVGAVLILAVWRTPGYEVGFFAGAMLIFGGLLLRIESAITRGMNGQHDASGGGTA